MFSVYRIYSFVCRKSILYTRKVLRKAIETSEYIPVGSERNFGFYDHK